MFMMKRFRVGFLSGLFLLSCFLLSFLSMIGAQVSRAADESSTTDSAVPITASESPTEKDAPVIPQEPQEAQAISHPEMTIGMPKPRIKTLSYHDIRPQWAFQLNASVNPFGGQLLKPGHLVDDQGDNSAYGFQLSFEFQPAFLQSIGVIGLGPTVGVYPIFAGGVTSNPWAIYSLGGQVRYQARFFRKQFIVPVFSYSVDYFSYRFTSGKSGRFFANGPAGGIWILLNALDPGTAAEFYVDNGVLRTYIIAEARMLEAQSSEVSLSGFSYYFGFRFEF
jgi:hypothetical protein